MRRSIGVVVAIAIIVAVVNPVVVSIVTTTEGSAAFPAVTPYASACGARRVGPTQETRHRDVVARRLRCRDVAIDDGVV
jgi:hypothetical protein